MTIWKKMIQSVLPRRIRRREPDREKVSLNVAEPVSEQPVSPVPEAAGAAETPPLKLDREIDFSRVQDLEAYTENLNVPEESIERWISAGLLYPDEIRTAERMIKIIRKRVELSRAA